MHATTRTVWLTLAVLALTAWQARSLHAAATVELEVVADPRASITASQTWVRDLARAGVQGVRIRSARSADKPAIDNRGTVASPAYVVTATLTAGDELLLPGARFKLGEAARVARWLEDLATNGPPDQRPAPSAFGLAPQQFAQVRAGLAQPVLFSTKGAGRADAFRRIAAVLKLPVQADPRAVAALGEDRVADELVGLSSGTALACLLRPMGYCLAPRADAAGRVETAVVRARPGMEVWPIGWVPEKPPREVLPAQFEFLNVNIQGVMADKALEAIAGRMKVPCLIDHNALARHGIDPAKTPVTLPQSRTFYGKALQRVLFQAGLKSELRVDESGKPLLWITTIKPL